MTKVMISEKQVVRIQEFMLNYIGISVQEKKLSHDEVVSILIEKGIPIPKKVSFNVINKEALLKGDYVLVKDKNCQILAYQNPMSFYSNALLFELRSKFNLEKVKKARRKFLEENGYIETKYGVIDQWEEEINIDVTEHVNRQKQFVMCQNKSFRK